VCPQPPYLGEKEEKKVVERKKGLLPLASFNLIMAGKYLFAACRVCQTYNIIFYNIFPKILKKQHFYVNIYM
jgi:hypothetical protein